MIEAQTIAAAHEQFIFELFSVQLPVISCTKIVVSSVSQHSAAVCMAYGLGIV